MSQPPLYADPEPSRAEVDAWRGPAVLEFGAAWCGHCRAAQPHVGQALSARPGLRHLQIADGPGLPLGRSFRVKLWPTLIVLNDGQEVARVVRPTGADVVREALAALPG